MEIKTSDVQAIVLDIDGTMCSLTKGVGEIYAELLHAQGLPGDATVLSKAARDEWGLFQDYYLNTSDHHQTTHHREREVWLEFVRRVFARAGLPYGNRTQVVRSIYDAFASSNFRGLEPGIVEFVQKARSAGLRVLAASNNDERSKVTLQELGITEYLSGVFVAGDLGWKKPSPNYFVALESRLHMNAGHILHVGNNFPLDVEAAVRCGWSAILYDPTGMGTRPSVKSHEELGRILGL